MSKTLTLRIDEATYNLFKKAAEAEKRPVSNYIEYAALKYMLSDLYVSDEEMEDIMQSYPAIKKGLDEAKEGK
jgi:hypothetical protein